jgi:hypothetical protein
MKQQTAVEWLALQTKSGKWRFGDTEVNRKSIIAQAKEMEKEQMFKALVKGADVHDAYDIELEFNEYYKETFKSE